MRLPKSQQPKAKRALQEIWMAETKADAEAAFDAFIESYRVKYEKAAECLQLGNDRPARTNIVTAQTGTWVFKPRGQWHTFWNAGDAPCEIIEVIRKANRRALRMAVRMQRHPAIRRLLRHRGNT